MFSSALDYALRAVICLASRRGSAVSAQEIARTTRTPPGYLAKVLKDLARAGIVTSRRGPNGGFTLVRDPMALTVLEVVNAVDRIKRIRECPMGDKNHAQGLCRLHKRLDDALGYIEQVFAESTIGELAAPAPQGECRGEIRILPRSA